MAASAGLGSAMREEVWAIVRAAVDEATRPLVAKHRELEARLERAEQERDAAVQAAKRAQAGGVATVMGAPAPRTIPDIRVSGGDASFAPSPHRPRMASMPPTGYGVSVVPGPRPTFDLDKVGPVDIEGFDGGRAKRRVAAIVIVVMVAVFVSVVAMALASHS